MLDSRNDPPRQAVETTQVERLERAVRDSDTAVFTRGRIAELMLELSTGTDLPLRNVVQRRVLRKATLTTATGKKVIRYARPDASIFQIALSLTANGYLSHGAAVYLNGLAKSAPKTIHVNEEQSPKPRSRTALAQDAIDRAFRGKQRKSNRQFTYRQQHIVILNGKQTGRLGTGALPGPKGEKLPVTLLARTLVDVVVRPDYAGGPNEILKVYKRAAKTVSIDEILLVLKQLDYVYPYHQAIGFYLGRAGLPDQTLQPLRDLGLDFDFYLGYGLENPAHDPRWRIFIPNEFANAP